MKKYLGLVVHYYRYADEAEGYKHYKKMFSTGWFPVDGNNNAILEEMDEDTFTEYCLAEERIDFIRIFNAIYVKKEQKALN